MIDNPVANFCPIHACEIATATVEADEMQFRVVGRGEVAMKMAEATVGGWAEIEGDLVVHKRKAKNREHEQWEILSKNWKNT